MTNVSANVVDERELVIVRVLDAPRSLVFKMWTDPVHMAQWWGPNGFTNPVCELDPRPGGAILIHMKAHYGQTHPMTGTFVEVTEPERLVFSTKALDDQGNPVLEGLVTVSFDDLGANTRLTVQARAKGLVDMASRMLDGMEAGWTQSIERLEAYVVSVG